MEEVNRQEAANASAREGKVFEALLSSPDPEIQALAVTGMLEGAQPKKKKGGWSGFLGQYDQSPTYQRLVELANTPEQTAPATTPSRTVQTQTMQAPPTLRPRWRTSRTFT